MKKSGIKIRYCHKCGWLLRASWMAQELLTTFSEEIGELSLVPAEPGVYEIHVDDVMIWSRSDNKGFPEIKVLKQMVRDRISSDKDLGHTDRQHNNEKEVL